jgi:hypothetical protein
MLTEIIELKIGEVVVIDGVPISLAHTKRGAAFLVVGRPVIDRAAVRQAAERHRRRFDKKSDECNDDSNSRPAI